MVNNKTLEVFISPDSVKTKKITVSKYKYDKNGEVLAVTDTKGNIYMADEINWGYELTPKGILYVSLCNVGLNCTSEQLNSIYNDLVDYFNKNYELIKK